MSSFFKKIGAKPPTSVYKDKGPPKKKPGRFGDTGDANEEEAEVEEQSEGQGSKYEGPGGKIMPLQCLYLKLSLNFGLTVCGLLTSQATTKRRKKRKKKKVMRKKKNRKKKRKKNRRRRHK